MKSTITDPQAHKNRLPHWGWFLVFGIAFVVVAAYLNVGLPYQRQITAIRRIERLGGGVATVRGGPDWLRHFVGDAWMKGFDKVEEVHLRSTQANDALLDDLSHLKMLRLLVLDGTNVTDDGLRNLSGMKGIEFLRLDGTEITDDGLDHLSKLTTLKLLMIRRTHVTREGKQRLEEELPKCLVYRY